MARFIQDLRTCNSKIKVMFLRAVLNTVEIVAVFVLILVLVRSLCKTGNIQYYEVLKGSGHK